MNKAVLEPQSPRTFRIKMNRICVMAHFRIIDYIFIRECTFLSEDITSLENQRARTREVPQRPYTPYTPEEDHDDELEDVT